MDLHPRRPIPLALSLVAFAALALTVMAYWAHCGHTPPATRQAAGAGWGSAPARPAPSPTPPRLAPSSGPTDSATATAAHLQAARVVEQLTRLIDRGRLTLARRLLRSGDVWPRRELAAIRHIRFITARVWGDAGADSVVLAVTLRLSVRRGSPLSTGVDTLFFTLSRDGTPGDWLVTAVATSP